MMLVVMKFIPVFCHLSSLRPKEDYNVLLFSNNHCLIRGSTIHTHINSKIKWSSIYFKPVFL
jgi:hypothetical protein